MPSLNKPPRSFVIGDMVRTYHADGSVTEIPFNEMMKAQSYAMSENETDIAYDNEQEYSNVE